MKGMQTHLYSLQSCINSQVTSMNMEILTVEYIPVELSRVQQKKLILIFFLDPTILLTTSQYFSDNVPSFLTGLLNEDLRRIISCGKLENVFVFFLAGHVLLVLIIIGRRDQCFEGQIVGVYSSGVTYVHTLNSLATTYLTLPK